MSQRHWLRDLPLWVVTGFSLGGFAFLVGLAVYILGVPWANSWQLGMEPLAWKDRLLYAGGVATLSGAVVALVVNYRKQRDAETGRFATSFADAAGQLGDAASAVRIAGVYALAALADRYPDRRQQCIDVLCGYLRLPYNPEAGATHLTQRSVEVTIDRRTVTDTHTYRPNDREVRLTIIRVIRDHLRPRAANRWTGHDFDFTGATFDGGDLSAATFSGGSVSFKKARFSGGGVSFDGARFSGGWVSFSGAEFSGGRVPFDRATFSGGWVSFSGAEFSGGRVPFTGAKFSGGKVNFDRAKFSGGSVSFRWATFSGGSVTRGGQDFRGWPEPAQ